jgi:hypothetical protein
VAVSGHQIRELRPLAPIGGLALLAGIQSMAPLLILTLPNAFPSLRTAISISTLPIAIAWLMLRETSWLGDGRQHIVYLWPTAHRYLAPDWIQIRATHATELTWAATDVGKEQQDRSKLRTVVAQRDERRVSQAVDLVL